MLVNSEDDVLLYDRLLKNDLSSIIETLNTNSLHLWENKISNLDSIIHLYFYHQKAKKQDHLKMNLILIML